MTDAAMQRARDALRATDFDFAHQCDDDALDEVIVAVLKGVREPSYVMVEAGTKVEVGHSWGRARTSDGSGEYCYMPENVWVAMIDTLVASAAPRQSANTAEMPNDTSDNARHDSEGGSENA